MANEQTSMTPPPMPDVKRTTADKIGGFLGAISQGGALGSISDAIEQHHQKRLAEAKMYHDVMVEKISNPAYADEAHPDHQATQHAYEAAKQAYLKAAGVNKETKQQIQQRTAIAEHHVKQGQGDAQGGAGGAQQPPSMSPPPAADAPAGGDTDSMPGASGASAAVPPPPKPDMTDIMAGVPGERQKMEDARAESQYKKKSEIDADAAVKVAQAKPPSSSGRTALPATDTYYSLLDKVNPDTGEKYTNQEALKAVTDAQTKSGKPTPFQEYMSDPENYDKFQKEKEKAKGPGKGGASIGAVYGIYRMLEMGYKQNPEILPVVAAMAPEVFAKAGMKMPPEMAKILGKVPLDQPLSPTTGEPIGTSMPGAPTGSTRNQAQTAARALTELPSIRKQVDDLKGYLGPGEGRLNVKYLLGKAGSTGDPKKDEQLSELRTHLMFLAGAAAKFHLNSVRAMHDFESIADSGKDSAEALKGFLNSVEEWGTTAEKQQKGYGETKETQKMTPPPSASSIADGTKGTWKGKPVIRKGGKWVMAPAA